MLGVPKNEAELGGRRIITGFDDRLILSSIDPVVGVLGALRDREDGRTGYQV